MIIHADCVEAMQAMEPDSIDAIVCDPPYGLEFMGKEWDKLDRIGFHQGEPKMFVEGGSVPLPPTPRLSQGKGKRCDECNKYAGGNPKINCTCETPRFRNVSRGAEQEEWHGRWVNEAFRVLKPGGHLLAFGGTRTYHRLACAVEDAGFEIRDSLIWIYGSGFPKSLDVSKAIDRRRDDDARPVCRFLAAHLSGRRISDIVRAMGFAGNGDHGVSAWFREDHVSPRVPTWEQWEQLRDLLGFGAEVDEEVWRLNGRKGKPGDAWDEREVIGSKTHGRSGGEDFAKVVGSSATPRDENITAPATPEAQHWQGWGTALKPSHEPIVVARKPLVGTVAANVLEHGTGALNIDGCRIEHESDTDLATSQAKNPGRDDLVSSDVYGNGRPQQSVNTAGRWPPNLTLSHLPECKQTGTRKVKSTAHYKPGSEREHESQGLYGLEGHVGASPADSDGTETIPAYTCAPGCPVAELDRQSGETGANGGSGDFRQHAWMGGDTPQDIDRDKGGASRFFYVAKASRAERNAGLEGFEEHRITTLNAGVDGPLPRNRPNLPRANVHPTVKPIALMRWLVRLVTPKGGTVLDPFTGSGSTGVAAVLEGFDFVGIEREAEYVALAEARVRFWAQFPGADVDKVLLSDARAREIEASGQLGLL